jgi:hypothetical protein
MVSFQLSVFKALLLQVDFCLSRFGAMKVLSRSGGIETFIEQLKSEGEGTFLLITAFE